MIADIVLICFFHRDAVDDALLDLKNATAERDAALTLVTTAMNQTDIASAELADAETDLQDLTNKMNGFNAEMNMNVASLEEAMVNNASQETVSGLQDTIASLNQSIHDHRVLIEIREEDVNVLTMIYEDAENALALVEDMLKNATEFLNNLNSTVANLQIAAEQFGQKVKERNATYVEAGLFAGSGEKVVPTFVTCNASGLWEIHGDPVCEGKYILVHNLLKRH